MVPMGECFLRVEDDSLVLPEVRHITTDTPKVYVDTGKTECKVFPLASCKPMSPPSSEGLAGENWQ